MIKLFRIVSQMNSTSKYNKFIHYLQKIPLVGKSIPDKWYKSRLFDSWLQYVWLSLTCLFSILVKLVSLTLIYLLGLSLIFLFDQLTLSPLSLFYISIILFSLINGPLTKAFFISPVKEKDIIAIKIFRVVPLTYYQSSLAYESVEFLLVNTVALGLIFNYLNAPVVNAILLIFCAVALRVFASSLMIQLYKRGLDPNNDWWSWATIISVLTTTFTVLGLLMFGITLPVHVILSPLFFVLCVGLLGIGIWGWSKGTSVNTVAYQSLNFETLKTHQKVIDNAQAIGSTLEEDDYNEIRHQDKMMDKKGIAYLNHLFFERTRKYIYKQIMRRIIVSAIITVVVTIVFMVQDSIAFDSDSFLYVISFISLIASHYLYYSEGFSKFCFYNLDRQLMKYRFYRNPDVVMESIKIRFLVAIKCNTPVLLVVMSCTSILFFISNDISLVALILTLGFQLLLMLFFSMNYLILYYSIQPYTESLKSKSIVYSVINFLFLMLLYVSFQVDFESLTVFIPGISVFILIYIPAGLLTVYKRAPKQFKLRV